MLMIVDNDTKSDDLLEKVFPTDTTTGRLVIIGATSRENGKPNAVDEMEDMAPMWVGWVAEGTIDDTLSDLQMGNPNKLAIYAVGRATISEVNDLKLTLRLSGAKLSGNWFKLWTPLAFVIQALRGDND